MENMFGGKVVYRPEFMPEDGKYMLILFTVEEINVPAHGETAEKQLVVPTHQIEAYVDLESISQRVEGLMKREPGRTDFIILHADQLQVVTNYTLTGCSRT